ncbi:hypothetical protein JOF35_000725 [Streptomyces demainii]|uniref:Uncharacterized protein n=1 Tax=Streptomyces demainii TaxID=588122 RepID=A0ABT9KJ53_9ACTN|nr:hypothetical protein [Streptomyces demainii]
MLASTVQFSNNDPYPVTHTSPRSTPEPVRREQANLPAPSDTQQHAQHSPEPILCSTPKQY